jgi:polysaccharide export outer membrane protein
MLDRRLKSWFLVSNPWSALWLAAAAGAMLCVTGCMTFSRGGVQDLRLPRYRPDVDRQGAWFEELHPSTNAQAQAVAPAVVAAVPPPVETGPVAVPPSEPVVGGPGIESSTPLRTIMGGDRLTIMVDGPEPQKFEDVVDDRGCVRLPRIGEMQAAGKTTSQVEDEIERAYIEGKIYKYVSVTVVSLDDEFFVRGEVKREGRYALTGAMSLGKAITVASGFTEYANRGKVQVKRGSEVMIFDMERVYSGKDEDPLLRRGDEVFVPRRWM